MAELGNTLEHDEKHDTTNIDIDQKWIQLFTSCKETLLTNIGEGNQSEDSALDHMSQGEGSTSDDAQRNDAENTNDELSKICQLLEEIGLTQHQHIFVEEEIGLDDLPDLTEADLEKMGVTKKGHRLKLLRAAKTIPASNMNANIVEKKDEHVDIIQPRSDLRFHHLHGTNVRISNSGLTAMRLNLSSSKNCTVMSNRPLRDGEMFEVQIDQMDRTWGIHIIAGVTLIRPERLQFPEFLNTVDHDTWLLIGDNVGRDGEPTGFYGCNLRDLEVGSRVGVVRANDGSLHYFVDGKDQGVAFDYIPPGVYAMFGVEGQCAEVSVVQT